MLYQNSLPAPGSLGTHRFLHRINTSGVKIIPTLKKSLYLFHKEDNLKLLLSFKGSQPINLSFFFGFPLFNIAKQIILKHFSFWGPHQLSRGDFKTCSILESFSMHSGQVLHERSKTKIKTRRKKREDKLYWYANVMYFISQ